MKKLHPFLGETTDRNKALAGYKSLKITVRQDPYKHHTREDHQRLSIYTKANVPRHQKCCNPRCQRGGLDLQMLMMTLGNISEQRFSCEGDEGSPAGRRKGNPCDNVFVVSIEIEPAE